MRKRDISKFEIRASLGFTAINEAAGYGSAGAQNAEPDSKAFREGYRKLAIFVLTPMLAVSAIAGVLMSVAG